MTALNHPNPTYNPRDDHPSNDPGLDDPKPTSAFFLIPLADLHAEPRTPTDAAPVAPLAETPSPLSPLKGRAESLNADDPASQHAEMVGGMTIGRELAEIVVFVSLVLVLSGFFVDKYVIPTGSMNPGLMGRHKEVVCPECGHTYVVNASGEVEPSGAPALKDPEGRRVAVGTCVNCRCPALIENEISHKGDQIAAMRVGYQLPSWLGGRPPQRWETVVFHSPEESNIRFIKRLVGLPNETVRIWGGDLYRRLDDPLQRAELDPEADSQGFSILRKPLRHQEVMRVLVYDDRHRPQSLEGLEEWRRWRLDAGWSQRGPGAYHFNPEEFPRPQPDEFSELRYRHRVPSPAQWETILAGGVETVHAESTLVTDFDSFNSDIAVFEVDRIDRLERPWMIQHWVGDLILEFGFEPIDPNARLRIELVRGGRRYWCVLDMVSTTATLLREVDRGERGRGGRGFEIGPTAPAPLQLGQRSVVQLIHTDGRLALTIDGQPLFGEGWTQRPHSDLPTARDTEPAALAAQGGRLEITDLTLWRDLYYSREPTTIDNPRIDHDPPRDAQGMQSLLADANQFDRFEPGPPLDFPIGPDRYLMLGDNSLWSRDSRAWSPNKTIDGLVVPRREPWEVPASLIIGRAFVVHWPHTVPIWPHWRINRDLCLPSRPNFEKMRWIR